MLRLLLIPLVMLGLLAGAMMFSGGAAERRADFTFINRGDLKTLDLAKMSYMQDIRMAYALWEGLYTLEAQTLDAVPGCAFPIEVSSDKRVYTFHIRPAARWTNGDPLLGRDFVYSWRRILQEQGDYADLLHYIKGAAQYQEDFAAGKQPDFLKTVAVEMADDRTLRVTLNDPTTFFPDLCAFPPFFPSHEASMLDPNSNTGAVRSDFTRPPHLVTNGPYHFERWDFKRRLRLVASDFYWDRASVKSKVIDMLIVEDPQSEVAMYDSGAVDWISELTGPYGAELFASGRKDLRVFTSFGTYFYSFNCRPRLPDGRDNPFHKQAVRQALTMAIEKQFIVDNIMRLGEPVATHYIPPGVFPGYRSPAGLPYDVARARKLLADAGYPHGEGFPAVKLNFNNEGTHREVAEYVQREWKKNLNIDVELDGKELKLYGEQLRNKQYAVSRASWYGDYNDISTFTDKYLPNGGNNDADWNSAQYASLCAQAARETDQTKRLRLFERAERILLDDAPILPLYHYVNAYMFRDNVRGIPLNPRAMLMFKAVEVVRRP